MSILNRAKLRTTIAEAHRFIRLAEAADKSLIQSGGTVGSKETGAARRASMDLTRSLADLRKAN